MSEHQSLISADDGILVLSCETCGELGAWTGVEVATVEQLSEAWAQHRQDTAVAAAVAELAGRIVHHELCTNTHSEVQCGRCLVLHAASLEAEQRGHAAGAVAALVAILTEAGRGAEEQEVWLHSGTGWLSGEVPVDVAGTSPQRAVTATLRHCAAEYRGRASEASESDADAAEQAGYAELADPQDQAERRATARRRSQPEAGQ